jgi:hypothetical protein
MKIRIVANSAGGIPANTQNQLLANGFTIQPRVCSVGYKEYVFYLNILAEYKLTFTKISIMKSDIMGFTRFINEQE